jgi:hypothetical protein
MADRVGYPTRIALFEFRAHGRSEDLDHDEVSLGRGLGLFPHFYSPDPCYCGGSHPFPLSRC